MVPSASVRRSLAAADLYKALSQAFAYPEEAMGWRERILEALAELRRWAPQAARAFEGMLAHRPNPRGYVPLQKGVVPISESGYRPGAAAEVVGFYRAFGVRPRTGENPDALPYELEFLSYLALKVALAPTRESRAVATEGYRRFLTQHVGAWAPQFCARLRQAGTDAFYRAAAEALRAWLEAEQARAGAAPRGAAADGRDTH